MPEDVFQDITNMTSKRIKLTIHKSTHRKKLLRWVYEVCRDFRYSLYTYTTTVLIIDKYTEKNGFELSRYQLIGVSSLFLAAKIEESTTKPVAEYSVVTDGAFSEAEIAQWEWRIFESLGNELHLRLPQFFFNPDYFRNNFSFLGFEQKKELLNCFIAARLETKSYSDNAFLLYVESKREMENWLTQSRGRLAESMMFYIKNNSIAIDVLRQEG